MHINMKKKSLFRRVSGVLTGLFFSTSLILAANENGQLFGSETLIVVVALLLFFVPRKRIRDASRYTSKNIAQVFILERYFFVSICPAVIPGTCLSVFLAAVLPLCL